MYCVSMSIFTSCTVQILIFCKFCPIILMCVFHVAISLSFLLYTIYSGLISKGKICGFCSLNRKNYNLLNRVPQVGRLGFSVASCGHGSQMTRKAMLDKSGAYSKLSAKAELNLQLRMALQLHAVRPAGSLPFMCTKYLPMHEISKLTESDQAVSL